MASFPGNVLLIWDRAGDYHLARFRALSNLYPDGEVLLADLGSADGLYGWKHDLNERSGFHTLSDKPVEKADLFRRFSHFRKLITEKDIRIVGLSGYGRIEYLIFLVWCWFKGIRVVLFAESWYGESGFVNALKGFFLDFTCHGFLVSGKRARHHFEFRLGIPSENIKTGYSVVDNRHFDQITDVEREKILLCVARFAPEKNLEILISAFKKSDLSKTWKLILVGGGPLQDKLQELIGDFSSIHLHSWLSYEALPLIYAQASFFILPSKFEPWGLVVNEAMAANLPVAVSDACGCTPDLVGLENGFTFDENDEGNIVAVMDAIAATTESERKKMGRIGRQKIENYSPENWARNFIQLAFG